MDLYKKLLILSWLQVTSSINIGAVLYQDDHHLIKAFQMISQHLRETMYSHRSEHKGTIQWSLRTVTKPLVHYDVIRKVCDLVELSNISVLFGPADAKLGELIELQAQSLQIPYFKIYWESNDYNHAKQMVKGVGDNNFGIGVYPSMQHLDVIINFLLTSQWDRFTFIYMENSSLHRLHQVLSNERLTMQFQGRLTIKMLQITSEHSFLAMAKKIKNQATECKNSDCIRWPANLLLIDIPQRYYQKFFLSMLQTGLVTSNFWYFFTDMFVQNHTDIDWIAQNQARISYASMNLYAHEIDPTYYTYLMAILTSTWADTNPYATYFPLADVLLLSDAMHAFAEGHLTATREVAENMDKPKTHASCGWTAEAPTVLSYGQVLYNYIVHSVSVLNSTLKISTGLTGKVSFDSSGHRVNVPLSVYELFGNDTFFRKSRVWDESVGLLKGESITVGPRKTHSRPDNFFRVAAILAAPYVMRRNNTDGQGNYEGFCVDLLDILKKELGFDVEIHEVVDNTYGSIVNGSWNGLVGEILRDEADMAIGPLTVTYDRARVVDFTKPFLQTGISILMKVQKTQPASYFSFLRPMHTDIWWYMVLSFFATCAALFVVATLTPFERVHRNLPGNCNDQAYEKNLSLANCIWLVTCTMLNANADSHPKSSSTRLLLVSWWIFCLILVATYTANFAAVLAVQKRFIPIRGFEELANNSDYACGCVESGSTCNFFKRSKIPTFAKIGRRIKATPNSTVGDNEQGVERVLKEKYVFLMETISLEYAVLQNCNLTEVSGIILGSQGYGIALKKGSPWTDRISRKILSSAETGRTAFFKNIWWKGKRAHVCPNSSPVSIKNNRHSLEVDEVLGLFISMLVGMGVALIIAVFEFMISSRSINPQYTFVSILTSGMCGDLMRTLGWSLFCPLRTRPVEYPIELDELTGPKHSHRSDCKLANYGVNGLLYSSSPLDTHHVTLEERRQLRMKKLKPSVQLHDSLNKRNMPQMEVLDAS